MLYSLSNMYFSNWRPETLSEIFKQIYFTENFNILNFNFNSEILKRVTMQNLLMRTSVVKFFSGKLRL